MEVKPITLPVSDVRDWSQLPLDALSVIFAKLGAIEILMGAGLVCCSWLEAAKVPDLWRFVDMTHHKVISMKRKEVMCAMARVAVDRSAGKLESFWAKKFATCDLVNYIAERTNSLKSIRLTACTYLTWEALAMLAAKFPLLEEVEYSYVCKIPEVFYKYVGSKCPRLRRLWVHTMWVDYDMLRRDFEFQMNPEEDEDEEIFDYERWEKWKNADAFAIADRMHELRLLQISGNCLTNKGVYAILEGCSQLECLDLHGCRNVHVDDHLRTSCAKIRHVRLPGSKATCCECEKLSIIEEDEGKKFMNDDLPEGFSYDFCSHKDDDTEDDWDVCWDDIFGPSNNGHDPDLSNMTCDDVTKYTYIHDYYSL